MLQFHGGGLLFPQAISVLSRSALIHDAFSLVLAGELSLTSALDLMSYLDKERHFAPWFMVRQGLEYASKNLALEDANDNFRVRTIFFKMMLKFRKD